MFKPFEEEFGTNLTSIGSCNALHISRSSDRTKLMAPPTYEEMFACAGGDTDSNEFEGPIASKSSASSPAHSNDSKGFTEGELETFVDTLEVTTILAGDTRAPISKPKPSHSNICVKRLITYSSR